MSAFMNDTDSLVGVEPGDWRLLLSAAERARMLDDIARVSLAAGVRLLPGRPWSMLEVAPGGVAERKSAAERLGLLEYVLPVLTQALRRLESSPLTRTAAHARPVAPPRARRVTAPAVLAYARRAGTRPFIEETVALVSVDSPENRAVKSFLSALIRDCGSIKEAAEEDGEAEAAGRADRCACALSRLAAQEWLAGVAGSAEAWRQPPTQRATLRPEYARVFREMARFRAQLHFDRHRPLLALPPRETWRLYETWCFFAVLNALRSLGWGPAAAPPAMRTGRMTFSLATDMASEIGLCSAPGRHLILRFNQAFAEGGASLSHTMQPDITLSEGETVWVLDAKFKPYALPGEEGEDINQMHAYRDAITRPDGGRCVARAWCLYAGLADAPNRPRITYGRAADTPVGALCLRPGDADSFSRLCALLDGWLSAPSPPGG